MSGPRAVASGGASTPPLRGRRRTERQGTLPAPPETLAPARSWIELDATTPLPGSLDLPTSVVLAPADSAGQGVHRIRGLGLDGLRRRLVADFLAMGFEVAQARHDGAGGLLAGPWVLEMRPPLDLGPAASTLRVRGQVRIRAGAVGAFAVQSDGDLVMEDQAHWRARLGTAGSVRTGEGCRIDGPVACGGQLDLGAGSLVAASVRCATLRLGARARIAGGLAMQQASETAPALVAVHRRASRPPLRPLQPEPLHVPEPEAAPEFPRPRPARATPVQPGPPAVLVEQGGPAQATQTLPRHTPVPIVPVPFEAPASSPAAVEAEAEPEPAQQHVPAPEPAIQAAPPPNERPEPPREHRGETPTPRPPRPGAGWSQYHEFPERGEVELDDAQAWRLLGRSEWLDVPSREALRGEEFEFEGRTVAGEPCFSILRGRRHVREVDLAQVHPSQADPLLRIVAYGRRPLLVRGRVHAGHLRFTMRAPDRATLDEALAQVEALTSARDEPGEAAPTQPAQANA